MKIIIVKQVGSAYRFDGNSLEYTPVLKDNIIDTDEFYGVDIDLMKDEPLSEPYYSAKTFGELYERIEWELKDNQKQKDECTGQYWSKTCRGCKFCERDIDQD